MTTARIDWTTALTPGAVVVPVVLVAGVPVVLTPGGIHPTATAVTSGTVDARWWPGTGTLTQTLPDASTIDPVQEWLKPEEQWEIYETTQPAQGDVRVEPLRFNLTDAAGAATAMLSGPNARTVRLLAADTAATGDVTISDAAGLPTSGIAHIGREAVLYSGVTGNVLNVSQRGAFGSKARVHLVGNGTQSPLVVIGQLPRYWHGRRAAVFLCKLIGTTLYDPTLVYLGTVGAGIQVVDRLMQWQLVLDHSTQAMAQKLQGASITIFGYEGSPAFFRLVWDAEVTGTTWYADGNSAVRALQATAVTNGVHCQIILRDDRMIYVRNQTSHSGAQWVLNYAWDTTNQQSSGWENDIERATNPLPPTFMHCSPSVALGNAGDFDKIPDPTPATATQGSATATASPAIVGKTDHVDKAFCAIRTRFPTSGGVPDTITTNAPAVWYFDSSRPQISGDGEAAVEFNTRISTPTQFVIGAVAEGGDCLSGLQALAAIIGRIQGTDLQTESVDWDAIAQAFASRPMGRIPAARRYLVDGDSDTLIELLVQECRLRGYTLTVRNGLVSAYRLANLASTEPTRRAITEDDIVVENGRPLDIEVVDGIEPVASAIEYTLPVGGSYTWRDATSADEFGEGKTIKCTALASQSPSAWANSAPGTEALAASAQQLLGVLALPQRIIRVVLPASFWDVAAGDVVAFTHSSVPNWYGTRGLTAALCQVMEVRRTFVGGAARVQLALRLADDPTLAGWAPAAFVAAGGVDHASKNITVDTGTAWGSNGFAPDYDASGNPVTNNLTCGFAVGDKVVLSQMNAESPIADEHFTILNISGTTVSLNTFPSTSMATAAASQYGVALRFDVYGTAVTRQRKYLFIADHTSGTYITGDAAKEWA
jgi:hypothetical protein